MNFNTFNIDPYATDDSATWEYRGPMHETEIVDLVFDKKCPKCHHTLEKGNYNLTVTVKLDMDELKKNQEIWEFNKRLND